MDQMVVITLSLCWNAGVTQLVIATGRGEQMRQGERAKEYRNQVAEFAVRVETACGSIHSLDPAGEIDHVWMHL